MWFSSLLWGKGIITGDEFAAAVFEQFSRRTPIGRIAVEERKMTIS